MSGGSPLPRLCLLLDGEMTLLILLPAPTPTGGVPAQLALPRGKRARSRGRGGCERAGRSVGGAGASRSQGDVATNRRREASACAHLCCCAAVNCPPKSSIAQRSSIKT